MDEVWVSHILTPAQKKIYRPAFSQQAKRTEECFHIHSPFFFPAAIHRDPNLDTIMRQWSLFLEKKLGQGAHCGADECGAHELLRAPLTSHSEGSQTGTWVYKKKNQEESIFSGWLCRSRASAVWPAPTAVPLALRWGTPSLNALVFGVIIALLAHYAGICIFYFFKGSFFNAVQPSTHTENKCLGRTNQRSHPWLFCLTDLVVLGQYCNLLVDPFSN